MAYSDEKNLKFNSDVGRETGRDVNMPRLVLQNLRWALGGQEMGTSVEPRTEVVDRGPLREAATF